LHTVSRSIPQVTRRNCSFEQLSSDTQFEYGAALKSFRIVPVQKAHTLRSSKPVNASWAVPSPTHSPFLDISAAVVVGDHWSSASVRFVMIPRVFSERAHRALLAWSNLCACDSHIQKTLFRASSSSPVCHAHPSSKSVTLRYLTKRLISFAGSKFLSGWSAVFKKDLKLISKGGQHPLVIQTHHTRNAFLCASRPMEHFAQQQLQCPQSLVSIA
jgi:hypothetical protein